MSRIIEIESNLLPDAETEAFTGCLQGVQGTAYECLHGVSQWTEEQLISVLGVAQTAKNTQIEQDKPLLMRIGEVAAGGAVVIAMSMTLFKQPGDVQAVMYLLAAALILQFNVLELFDRVFSSKTRTILALDCVLWIIGISKGDDYTLAFCLLVMLATIALIRKMNRGWLNHELWKMTPEVQKALNASPDCRAYKAWAYEGGKIESRTLGESRGHVVTERVVDELFRDQFILGYYHGYQYTVKAEEAKKDAEIFQRAYKEAQARADEAEHDLQTLQARADEDRDTVESQRLYIRQLQQEVEQLKKANEDLLHQDPELLEVEPEAENAKAPEPIEPDEPIDDRIQQCLDEGMGVRETARALGVSPAKVSKVKNSGKVVALEATA